MALMQLLKDVVPPGVINVVTGYGAEAGAALAHSKGISKIGFTGSTATGTAVLQAAADNLIPATMELGGKSPNIFFSSIADEDDALLDKASANPATTIPAPHNCSGSQGDVASRIRVPEYRRT